MMVAEALDIHKTLPANCFYWSLIDAQQIPGARPHQLGFLFESVLPVPIEDVHAVYVRIVTPSKTDRMYLACGAQRSLFDEQLKANQSNHWLTLTPDSLPQFLQEQLHKLNTSVSADHLNLLVGEYLPLRLRRLRRRSWMIVAVAMLCLSLITTLGLQRRINAAHTELAQITQAHGNVFHEVLGMPMPAHSGTASQGETRFLAELRTLRATRQQPAAVLSQDDCIGLLADVLAHWPGELHLQTESLIVTPASITIRALALSSGDVQLLADSLQGMRDAQDLPGRWWEVQQPQINAARDGVQSTIQIKNVAETAR